MARKLDRDYQSWLHAYKDWTVPRSEAPESFIMWAGFYTLSSALRRRVKIPASLLGSYEIFPNLYVMFVGPPGGPRKSTTIRYAKALLRDIEDVSISSTATSTSKLIDIMADLDDGSISITSSEFGNFVSISGEEMYDFLTDVYDNPRKYVYTTRQHGEEEIYKPTINLLGATTPSWIQDYMPPQALAGGFARRCIFIYEETPRRRKLYYDDIDNKNFKRLGEHLAHDLRHISTQITGEFRHESEKLKKDIEKWYEKVASQPTADERIKGYLETKHIHVHKLAMILSIAESDELLIRRSHFEVAKEMLSLIEDSMPTVFSSVGGNPHAATLEKVRSYVRRKGLVSFEDLMGQFYHEVQAEDLRKILDALTSMGYIEEKRGKEMEGMKKGTYYAAK